MSNTHAAALPLAPRSIKTVNWIGLYTLIKKEVGRFLNVYTQTIIAPVVTTLLYYTIFALAFGGITKHIGDVPLLAFLAPGLIMMTMAQNAFANTSSSIVIAKVQGNIVDILLPPLSALEIYVGYVTGSIIRGMSLGLVTALVVAIFAPMSVMSLGTILLFGFLGCMMLGSLGLAAGIWSDKFDHIAAVTNFIVMPLTFLSGTFYSMDTLPEGWQAVAHFNPFFYMIDGFRSGFIGHADGHLAIGVLVLVGVNIALAGLTLWMLRTGYKIKS